MDGTDFWIPEPTPFDRKWYSHKFNHAALRYEIAMCIQTGWIVWVNGPFCAGSFSDVRIFREGLKNHLHFDERVEVDRGYVGEMAFSRPDDHGGVRVWYDMKSSVRARHECLNGKLKEFKLLGTKYRNLKEKHSLFFRAIVGIVQSEIRRGGITYQVEYRVRRATLVVDIDG